MSPKIPFCHPSPNNDNIIHNTKYKPLILTAVHLVAKTSNGSEAKGDLVVTKLT